jgi:hypothetical protein
MYHSISPVHTLIADIANKLGSNEWYYHQRYTIGYITLPSGGVAAVFIGYVNGVPSMDATIVTMPEDSAHVE